MKKLTVSKETFINMISGLISSGVTFDANENEKNEIVIIFSGGY